MRVGGLRPGSFFVFVYSFAVRFVGPMSFRSDDVLDVVVVWCYSFLCGRVLFWSPFLWYGVVACVLLVGATGAPALVSGSPDFLFW